MYAHNSCASPLATREAGRQFIAKERHVKAIGVWIQAKCRTPMRVLSAIAAIGVLAASAQANPRVGEPAASSTFEPMPTKLEAAAAELGAAPDKYVFDYLMLPMRDGVRLATIVIRPKAKGRFPTILERTPYVANGLARTYGPLFESNYVVLIQFERGSNFSEGSFRFLHNTTNDAEDTLSWVAAQPWSNGRVGAEGCSSTAENQLLLGARGHPALKALVPMSSGAGIGAIPGVRSQGLFYKGGVPSLGTWSLWYAPFGYIERPGLPKDLSPEEQRSALRYYGVTVPNFMDAKYAERLAESVRKAPSRDVLHRMQTPASEFEDFVSAGPADRIWRSPDFITSADTGATPALNINGWGDVGAYETLKLFEFQQHHPDQYLIMAPSGHCSMTRTSRDAKFGERPIGNSEFPYGEIVKGWFDRFLKEDAKAWKPMPKVQVFLLGANTWLTGDRWPLKETRASRLYLAGAGDANSLWGDGRLEPASSAKSAVDHFLSDPTNPVPSLAGGLFEPVRDQRQVEARQDVLVYSTAALQKGLTIAGDLRATLYVSVDTKDTDLAVKLVDVYPDGTAYNVQTGMLRLRYRDGFEKPKLLTPGQVYKVEVGGMATANYFAPGHRLRIEIAGSDFPNSDRNWNTGGRNELETAGAIANIAVHHGGARASYIEFTEYTGVIPQPGKQQQTSASQ